DMWNERLKKFEEELKIKQSTETHIYPQSVVTLLRDRKAIRGGGGGGLGGGDRD
ncbi:hypothetical protein H5410_030329, partial [Solanum commersonii]